MQLFYATKSQISEGTLSVDESNHCVRVLRKKAGDEIQLLDGEGGIYKASVLEANAKKCTFKVTNKSVSKNDLPHLQVLICPTKNLDRFEFFVEKACELGIKEITPVLAFNSERKHLNVEKLRKRMVAACKQSYTLSFPVIHEAIKFKEVISTSFEGAQKFIAHCHSTETPELKHQNVSLPTVVLIGPEGDFSKEEVELAEGNNFSAITLGTKRLRTETAGLYVCSVFNILKK